MQLALRPSSKPARRHLSADSSGKLFRAPARYNFDGPGLQAQAQRLEACGNRPTIITAPALCLSPNGIGFLNLDLLQSAVPRRNSNH
ncbi:uncharacterized protein JCM6883_002716 [Sporobolomyces salmoneus]|uniref:uncharacterized protein n=1 Tax=Sporobolomyces salmoneus TaxID=183962 RepID=UPI00316C9E75